MLKQILLSRKEEIIEQEYSRAMEEHYKESSELKRLVNTSKVIHTLLPKMI